MMSVPLRGAVSRRTLVLVAFPVCLPIGFTQVGPVQIVELVALAIAGLVLSERWLTGGLVVPPLGAFWGLAVFAAAAAATPLSVHEDATLRANMQLALGLLLALATIQAVESWTDVRVLLACLLVSAVLIAALALPEAGQQQARFGGAVVAGRVTGIFAQPNEFGLFAAMALMMALTSPAVSRGASRHVATISVLMLLAALAASLSRGAWVGAVAGTAGLALLLPTMRRRLVRVLLLAVILISSTAALAPDQPQLKILTARFQTITQDAENPYDRRPAIYAEAIRLAADRPWTGQGPGTFPVASASSIRRGESGEAEHAHNALLNMAAEGGLLALAAVIGLTLSVMAATVRTVRRLRRTAPREARALAGAGAALLVVVAHGMIDYPLRNPVIFLLVWMLAALVFASERLAFETTTGSTSRT